MTQDTWIDAMLKDIESKKKKEEQAPVVQLSESDMNKLADIMIKKMSDTSFDAENDKSDEKEKEPENPKPDESGEIPIE